MKWFLFGISLLATPWLYADEAAEDEAFFEYLGSFSDADDEWFDPLWLEEVTLPATADQPATEDTDDES